MTAVPAPVRERYAPRRAWVRRALRVRIAGPIALVLLGFLVLYPLAMVIISSLVNGAPLPHSGTDFVPRLSNYSGLWSSGTIHAFVNSMIVGVGGTVLALLIGGVIAWLVARTDVPCARLLRLAGSVPLFIPALVGAVAWSLLCAPDTGYVSMALHAAGIHWQFDVYSRAGMVLVFALYNVPYVVLFVGNALALMNAEMEEAASVHGAGRLRVALQTTLPLVRPALLNAALLVFVLILEDFPVSMILGFSAGVQTLSSRVYLMMSQSPPRVNMAAALGVVLMALTILVVVLQNRLVRGKSYATLAGKGQRAQRMKLGGWRWAGLAFVMLYLLFAVVLPVAALVVGALQKSIYTPSFGSLFHRSNLSFATLTNALTDHDAYVAAKNTITVGVWTVVLGTVICFFLAHYGSRKANRFGAIIARLCVLPAAVPGVVLGLGLLWAYTALPVNLYGTLTVMVLAFVGRFLPQGVGNMSSAIGQIGPDLEESAAVSGAGRVRSALWVTAPLMRSAVVSTGLLLFILSMRELSTSIFLYTAKTKVLSIYVFDLWSNGSIGPVAAISLAYSAFLFVIVISCHKWLNNA